MKNKLNNKKLYIVVMAMLISDNSDAQWTVNSFHNLETNPVALSTPFSNVVIDKGLGVNMMVTPSLLLPLVTGAGPTTVYPLTVNGTIALWDVTAEDNIRNIIGLSPTGGVAIFSGNDDNTGSGIRLNSPGSSAYPAGAVQTISNGPGTPGTPALQHINYTIPASGTTGTLTEIYDLDQNGDVNIFGGIMFPLLGGDLAMRQIQGLSPSFGIDMITGSYASGSTGTEILMTAPGYAANPGQIQTTAVGPASGVGLAYNLMTSNWTTTAPFDALQIDNLGNTRVGNWGPPPKDRLTVDGTVYINSSSNDPLQDRYIYGRTNNAALNVTSSDFTDGSHGACLSVISYSATATPYAPWGYAIPGVFLAKSFAQPQGNFLGLGYAYQNWEGTPSSGSIHNIFLINGTGQGVFGHDDDLSNITGNDVFTIKQSLGFYAPTDATPRTIKGHTNAGLLDIAAADNYSNGSDITLFGIGNSGQIAYTSFGSMATSSVVPGPGHDFRNFDGSTLQDNFMIGNNGQSIIGPAIAMANITGSDVLTVETSLGFYNSNDATWRTIDGNSAAAGLELSAHTNSTDGSNITMFGSAAADAGQIYFTSLGYAGNSMVFNNHDYGGTYSNVIITNQGQMVVGHNVSSSVIASGDVLTVNNQIGMYSATGGDVNINGNTTASALAIHANTGSTNGSTIEFYSNGSITSGSDRRGEINYISDGQGIPGNIGHNFMSWDGSNWNSLVRIYNNGAVAIGDLSLSMPGAGTNYMMYVQHGILTEHVRVADHTTGAWSDFVFNKDYKLRTLSDIETYVKENKHLPDFPSADDVEKNGIDVENMDAKLLQKIEELTLYVIQQNKRIEELEQKVAKQK